MASGSSKNTPIEEGGSASTRTPGSRRTGSGREEHEGTGLARRRLVRMPCRGTPEEVSRTIRVVVEGRDAAVSRRSPNRLTGDRARAATSSSSSREPGERRGAPRAPATRSGRSRSDGHRLSAARSHLAHVVRVQAWITSRAEEQERLENACATGEERGVPFPRGRPHQRDHVSRAGRPSSRRARA